MPYDELLEVNRLADIKLEKELYELILSTLGLNERQIHH
ncbi:hypothetical protein BBU29805_N16 (plasmid) [Borreliella burgdorferi 29805]|nr:hypothetical protein BBU29805_N16 [Borreliella burgdorferi 29805]